MSLLSATVNASLAELGHFPGSGMLLQELRHQNYKFHDLTTKLHEDNVTLQRIIEKQKHDMLQLQDKISVLQNQNKELKHEYRSASEKLKKVIIERDNLTYYSRMYAFSCLTA